MMIRWDVSATVESFSWPQRTIFRRLSSCETLNAHHTTTATARTPTVRSVLLWNVGPGALKREGVQGHGSMAFDGRKIMV